MKRRRDNRGGGTERQPEAGPLPFSATQMVRDRCLCFRVQRAARVLARRFDEAFRLLGLTNFQFSLMMSFNRPAPPQMSQVATWLAMDRTTLTANLKPLERRGLVSVAVDENDRRSRVITLTSKGRRLLARALPIWEREHAAVDRLLGQSGPERLQADLRAVSGSPPLVKQEASI